MDKIYCCAIPFHNASQQHQAAVDAGRPERSIYVEGRGNETFDSCISQFRGPGTLGLSGGLRVLGTTRQAVVDRVLILKQLQIIPYDLDTGERDETKLLNAAINKIHGAKALREDPKHARRIGAKGGVSKGTWAQKRRDELLREAVIIRLCEHPKLSWDDCAHILGGKPFSASTLRRKYGN